MRREADFNLDNLPPTSELLKQRRLFERLLVLRIRESAIAEQTADIRHDLLDCRAFESEQAITAALDAKLQDMDLPEDLQ